MPSADIATHPPGSQNSSEKMESNLDPRPHVPSPYLQQIRSLPVDFRLTDSRNSEPFEKSATTDAGNYHAISCGIAENGDLDSEVVLGFEDTVRNMDQVTEESPYSGQTMSVEDRNSVGDEELCFAASPLPSLTPTHTSPKWSDTTPYAAKKVCFTPSPERFLNALSILCEVNSIKSLLTCSKHKE